MIFEFHNYNNWLSTKPALQMTCIINIKHYNNHEVTNADNINDFLLVRVYQIWRIPKFNIYKLFDV